MSNSENLWNENYYQGFQKQLISHHYTTRGILPITHQKAYYMNNRLHSKRHTTWTTDSKPKGLLPEQSITLQEAYYLNNRLHTKRHTTWTTDYTTRGILPAQPITLQEAYYLNNRLHTKRRTTWTTDYTTRGILPAQPILHMIIFTFKWQVYFILLFTWWYVCNQNFVPLQNKWTCVLH